MVAAALGGSAPEEWEVCARLLAILHAARGMLAVGRRLSRSSSRRHGGEPRLSAHNSVNSNPCTLEQPCRRHSTGCRRGGPNDEVHVLSSAGLGTRRQHHEIHQHHRRGRGRHHRARRRSPSTTRRRWSTLQGLHVAGAGGCDSDGIRVLAGGGRPHPATARSNACFGSGISVEFNDAELHQRYGVTRQGRRRPGACPAADAPVAR